MKLNEVLGFLSPAKRAEKKAEKRAEAVRLKVRGKKRAKIASSVAQDKKAILDKENARKERAERNRKGRDSAAENQWRSGS